MSISSIGGYAPDKHAVLLAAEGRWSSIYLHLAPELAKAQHVPGTAGPCPVHGGHDGFRIFRKTATTCSGGVCQTCGIRPDGLALLMWVRDWTFPLVLQRVGALLGVRDGQGRCGSGALEPIAVVRPAPVVTPHVNDHWLCETLRRLWAGTLPLTDPLAEPARCYLHSRGIRVWARPALSRTVRFHPGLLYQDADGPRSCYPGIVCLLLDPNGQAVTLQRHYLTAQGAKAAVAQPKKMLPIPSGRQLAGCSVQTCAPEAVLDVCEGLETALAVETALGIPVWPMVNAYLLQCFVPPPSTRFVRIWADNDRKETGQKAALRLKARLYDRGIEAQILLPDLPIPEGAKGVDWNDVLCQQGVIGFVGHGACRAMR